MTTKGGEGDGGTLSHFDVSSQETLLARPHLFLVMDCEKPLSLTASSNLLGLDEVLIGRAVERELVRRGRTLNVRLMDKWMSSAHARLVLRDRAWIVEDQGSKNGILLNGAVCSSATLADGDILEIGHTLFLYRDALAPEHPTEVDGSQLRPPVPELATFVVPLARQVEALAQVAGQPLVSITISGDSGTGKEVVARAIHRLSGRQGAFIAVNCASIPGSLFEAELFGAKKGAFTGATEDRTGLIRAAEGGTLFLDEIGDLPASSQTALLRVLQEREVLPLGATRAIPVDLRVVTATHRDLPALVERGQFRADLYARLGGFRIALPPLAARREDLGMLVGALLRRGTSRPERVRITGRAARALLRYAWPLNIRELEKCLVTASALAGDAAIDTVHLPDGVRAALNANPAAPTPPLSDHDRRNREQLVELLRGHDGNIAAVGRAMGKAPMQIHRWIKRFGLDLDSFRRTR